MDDSNRYSWILVWYICEWGEGDENTLDALTPPSENRSQTNSHVQQMYFSYPCWWRFCLSRLACVKWDRPKLVCATTLNEPKWQILWRSCDIDYVILLFGYWMVELWTILYSFIPHPTKKKKYQLVRFQSRHTKPREKCMKYNFVCMGKLKTDE